MPRNGPNKAYIATWITPREAKKLKVKAKKLRTNVSAILQRLIRTYLEGDR